MAATPLTHHNIKPPSLPEKTSITPTQPHPCLIMLDKCSTMNELKQIHAQMIRSGLVSDTFSASKVVAFCALQEDSASLQYATLVFTQISNPNAFTYNSIIRGYTNRGLHREAILFYRAVIEEGLVPDNFTFPSLFKSCGDLDLGKLIHCHSTKFGYSSDSYVQNTLMNMYSNCGCLVSARQVFDEMPVRDVVSWATMIGAYAHWDRPVEALGLFQRMEGDNVRPNEVALINALAACARARDLEMAKWVHRYIEKEMVGFDVVLTTALMDVYCKCGAASLARKLFDEMPEKNLFCWNIMINGHVEESDYEEALGLFREMQFKGIKADKVTMASLVLASTQLGALELGKWLHAYVKKEGVEVDVVLGTAIVDMIHGNIEAAERVAKQLLELDPDNGGTYVLLSNIYCSLQKWDEAKRTRELMVERNIKKPPGCSLIEVDGIVYEFVKGDTSHPRISEINDMLEDVLGRLKLAGYVPNKSEVLIDMDEEEKENALSRHSEKLAISFGLISTSPGTAIRVVKNLRICNDCHSAIKLISKLYAREIIVRDRNRYHHFRNGLCSCKDFCLSGIGHA
ncbi:hypothetical protein Scep_008493 [Stephania cephalantha]|uniref:DYW domain-containing protein n=1 Tax=Stephania cephalantha TaxID=152367 RepID=A0AAP0KBT0_9MAGN